MIGLEEGTRLPKLDCEKTFVNDTKDKHALYRE